MALFILFLQRRFQHFDAVRGLVLLELAAEARFQAMLHQVGLQLDCRHRCLRAGTKDGAGTFCM